MPLSPTQTEIDLRAWILLATGLPGEQVFYANQEQGRPEKPYVTLLLATEQRQGRDFELTTATQIPATGRFKQYRSSHREGLLSVQAFGPGSRSALEQLELSKTDPDVADLLWRACVTVSHPVGGVRNLTRVLDTEWEERYQLDFIVRWGVVRERGVDVIESATLTADVQE